MTKAELIAKIAESAAISKSSAEQSLNILLAAIQQALATEGRLSLPGFGSLVVEERKERKGHNPRTGEPIVIPAAKVVKFRAGVNLKKQIQ
ncbi:HU family DNA-binding protein [Mailhella sp.]|uniref:HU family DNA-binding protein n=1 Tax=Mailhella sp. TaxID=1981029 RepID=UPI004063339E